MENKTKKINKLVNVIASAFFLNVIQTTETMSANSTMMFKLVTMLHRMQLGQWALYQLLVRCLNLHLILYWVDYRLLRTSWICTIRKYWNCIDGLIRIFKTRFFITFSFTNSFLLCSIH